MSTLLVGDSIALGMEPRLRAHRVRVAARAGMSVRDFALAAWSPLLGQARADGPVERVIVALGTNPTESMDLDRFRSQVEMVRSRLQQRFTGTPVIWIGPWAGPQATERFEVIREVVGAGRTVHGLALAAGIPHTADGIHFTADGYRMLADRMMEKMPAAMAWWVPVLLATSLVVAAVALGLSLAAVRRRRLEAGR